MYIGCLLIPIIILLVIALAVIRSVMSMGINVLKILGYKISDMIDDIWDFLTAPFRAKPVESDIEDPNYYQPTEERPKRYSESDGEYIAYKKIK